MCVCVCVCLYMYVYSAINKNEILPFATTWMDLEGIMLSEISQRKSNTLCYHLHVESKKFFIKQMNITKQTDPQIQRTN